VLLTVDDHHGVAVVVLLVFRHTEFAHQRIDPVLAGPDPRPAAIDPRSVRTGFGERAAADPVTRLQQCHRMTRLFQPQGRGQTRESGTDHAIVEL
jgi:hypothetical protein